MLKQEILLDKKDQHLLKEYTWHQDSTGYLRTRVKGRSSKVRIQHMVLPVREGFEVDHINRNKYDNRRSNLRYTTRSQNMMNGPKRKDNTSNFRGVNWSTTDGKYGKWRARICYQGKDISLGSFDDIEEAARAYKTAALKYFQEYMGEL